MGCMQIPVPCFWLLTHGIHVQCSLSAWMFNVHAIFIWQRMTLILCQIDFQSLLFPSLAFHISKLASLPKWTTRFHHQHSDFRCIVMVDHTRLETNYDCAALSQIVDVAYEKKVTWDRGENRQIDRYWQVWVPSIRCDMFVFCAQQ